MPVSLYGFEMSRKECHRYFSANKPLMTLGTLEEHHTAFADPEEFIPLSAMLLTEMAFQILGELPSTLQERTHRLEPGLRREPVPGRPFVANYKPVLVLARVRTEEGEPITDRMRETAAQEVSHEFIQFVKKRVPFTGEPQWFDARDHPN